MAPGQLQELDHEGGLGSLQRTSVELTADHDYQDLALRLYLGHGSGR
jgi:hypothetical protein